MNRAGMGLVIVALLALGDTRAGAQEIRWYKDLASAKKAAQEKNLPLFIDVGTVHCYWCKQLDATTFRDAEVAKLVGDHFIPVKLDASKDPAWAQSMGINAYPTLVFTTPEGKQLHRENGYADAARMRGILTRLKPTVAKQDRSVANPPGDTAVSALLPLGGNSRLGEKKLPGLPSPEALGISVEPAPWVTVEIYPNMGELYSQMRAMDVMAVRVERLATGYKARIEIPSPTGKTRVLEGSGASENAALARALAGETRPR